MKPLIMQSSPASCHFLPLRSKHPQHLLHAPPISSSFDFITQTIFGDEYKWWNSHYAVFSSLLSFHFSQIYIQQTDGLLQNISWT